MAKIFERIDEDLAGWIGRQHMFFTATAPSSAGHVNCSPKGYDSFRTLDDRLVAYLDYTGSGVETIAHLRDNGRIVIMFCAFDGPPRIVRFHGEGEVLQAGSDEFDSLLPLFEPLNEEQRASARSIIRIRVERISDSCGFGVPLMQYEGERTQADAWTRNRLKQNGPGAILQYQEEKNMASVDGLSGLDADLQQAREEDLTVRP